MILYRQRDGEIDLDGHYEGLGYSGRGAARNNPNAEGLSNYGPIPRGKYEVGHCYDHETLGPYVFNLTPIGHKAFGRTSFRIHGDNQAHDASHGCIIAGRSIRMRIRDTDQTELEVV